MKAIMNEEEFKSRIKYIILIGLFIIIAGCVGQQSSPEGTPTATVVNTTNTISNITSGGSSGGPNVTVVAAPPPTIKCELCHTNPQNLSPHVNGGKLCINCHGSQVHNIHVGEGTVNLDCKTCHGFPPKIPTVQKGTGPGTYSVCEQCHAPPPNNTQPSNGNLIVIHLSRGKYCTNCHGTDIAAIHAAVLSNAANATKSTIGTAQTSNSANIGNTQINISNTT